MRGILSFLRPTTRTLPSARPLSRPSIFLARFHSYRALSTTMPSPDYPFKRLIVCCDGTWQASNHGNRSVPSNVAKISRAISCYGYDTQDEKVRKHVPQVVYYDAGVGTAMGWLDKTYSGIRLLASCYVYKTKKNQALLAKA